MASEKHGRWLFGLLPARIAGALVVACAVMLAIPAWACADETGSYISEGLGITREAFVGNLSAHENDDYYLTSPYSADSTYFNNNIWSNGCPRDDGYVGMNCAGWVVRAVLDVGGDAEAVGLAEPSSRWESGASAWLAYVKMNGYTYYRFDSSEEMLASGVLQKGDIIFMQAQSYPIMTVDNHLFIFWGDSSSDDRIWQMADDNEIASIYVPDPPCYWYVFPLSNPGYVELQSKSAYPSLTDGNAAYSIGGATYGVYYDLACTQWASTIVTDASGYGRSSGLSAGTYYVRESVPPSGYQCTSTVYPVEVGVEGGVSVNCGWVSEFTGVEPEGTTTARAAPSGNEATTSVERLEGETRYATNNAVATAGWTSTETVVITTGATFPDALSATALAGLYECPVVQTEGASLSAEALSTIVALDAKRAIVIGGQSSVSDAVVDQLTARGMSAARYAGATRAQSSIQAYLAGDGQWGDTVIIASGSSYADALSASSYAFAHDAPIVLTEPDGTLSATACEALLRNTNGHVLIVGGTSVVSSQVEAQLAGMYVTRIAGSDRYETSAAFAEFAISEGMSADNLGIATGANFPDALSGGALCGQRNGIFMLIGEKNTETVHGFVERSTKNALTVFGGTSVVPSAWVDALVCTSIVDDEPVIESADSADAAEPAAVATPDAAIDAAQSSAALGLGASSSAGAGAQGNAEDSERSGATALHVDSAEDSVDSGSVHDSSDALKSSVG